MDAVITWVDGNDPRHSAKRAAALAAAGQVPKTSIAATRFAALNEIDYCLASLLRFAPFLNQIYLVTDDQRPDGLARLAAHFPQAAEKIRVIDHREIFHGHEDLLPCFNSTSIETMLHRLPQLSEDYIYLNDDFFLLRPALATDFFVDGLPVLRGRWRGTAKIRARLWLQRLRLLPRPASGIDRKAFMWQSARLGGAGDRFFWNDHTPHAFRKSVQAEFYRAHPHLLRQNAGNRFRNPQQFHITTLADQLEIAAGNRNFRETDLCYMYPVKFRNAAAQLRYVQRKIRDAETRNQRFACVQSLDQCTPDVRQLVTDWLDRLLFAPPAPSPGPRPSAAALGEQQTE